MHFIYCKLLFYNQALKILNSWKELFLVAADIRKDELTKVIPTKIKDLKEEQANIRSINCDKVSNGNDKVTTIMVFRNIDIGC